MRRAVRSEELVFILHLADVLGRYTLQEPGGLCQVEFWIARFDAKEEAIGGRAREAFDAEDRMIRLRQFVQGEHTDHGKNRGAKDGQFKGDGNEGGPTVQ